MLSFLIPALYIQVAPDRLTVRNVKTGEAISEVPEIAIETGGKPRVVAAGADARAHRSPTVQVVNPFAHPRSLVSDFTAADQLLKAFIRRLWPRPILALAPRVVLHPLGDPEGGFTQVEIRALRELALSAGASLVTIWQGRPLTDREIASREFPADGKVLD